MSAKVILHKTALMLQIQDYVRVGYRYWTAGTVTSDSALAWARKADRLYNVFHDRSRRARAKKERGEGSAVLLMHEIAGSGKLWWILLVTPNENLAHQLEPLKDALDRSSRIELTGYELCHLTKPGVAAPVLTWRMTRATYENRRTHIIDIIRRGGAREIRQLIVSLHRSPGFHGIRRQVKACRMLIRGCWRRCKGSQPFPSMPSRVLYLRRRKVLSVPLVTWLSVQSELVVDVKAARSLTSIQIPSAS
jgi:hypothetical protein